MIVSVPMLMEWRRVLDAYASPDDLHTKVSTDRCLLVIQAFAAHAKQKDHIAWPSAQTIARTIGASLRSVRYAIARLMEVGLIERLRRNRKARGWWQTALTTVRTRMSRWAYAALVGPNPVSRRRRVVQVVARKKTPKDFILGNTHQQGLCLGSQEPTKPCMTSLAIAQRVNEIRKNKVKEANSIRAGGRLRIV